MDNGLPFAQGNVRLAQFANALFDGVCDAQHTCPHFYPGLLHKSRSLLNGAGHGM